MTNNKKTALELFAIALYEKGLLIGNGDWMQNVLEEFKEIEKEQTINFINDWYFNGPLLGEGIDVKNTIEQHFNKTYKMANNKQKTPLEWFIEELEEKGDLRETPSIRNVQLNIDTSDYMELKQQAKEMEKVKAFEIFKAGQDSTEEGEKRIRTILQRNLPRD